jgi:hypothetical protein
MIYGDSLATIHLHLQQYICICNATGLLLAFLSVAE